MNYLFFPVLFQVRTNYTLKPKWSIPAMPWIVHCSSTAAYAVYLQYTLLIHCNDLVIQELIHLLRQHVCILPLHSTIIAV